MIIGPLYLYPFPHQWSRKKIPTKGEIDEEYDEIAPEPRDLPVVPDQIEVGDP